MLYVLTCADLAAVGPGVLNRWRRDLISQLYVRARERLAGDGQATTADQWLASQRAQLLALATRGGPSQWWEEQIAALPRTYFLSSESPQAMLAQLESLRNLPHHRATAWGRYLPQQNAVEYTIGTYEEIVPGIFHKLTGALTSQGMQILSAEIHTLAHQLVLDRFYVIDMDYAGEPPPDRIAAVTHALQQALEDPAPRQPAFRRLWAPGSTSRNTQVPRLPTRVRIDNNTSERMTILDIFTHDSRGLLYTISRTIFELGLSVHVAKIGTYLDQVVDVFYVTDQRLNKVVDRERLEEIRQRLLEAIERHAT
jgi:[protein-PII] uridylyltransferase